MIEWAGDTCLSLASAVHLELERLAQCPDEAPGQRHEVCTHEAAGTAAAVPTSSPKLYQTRGPDCASIGPDTSDAHGQGLFLQKALLTHVYQLNTGAEYVLSISVDYAPFGRGAAR